MSNRAKMQRPTFISRAAAGVVVLALAAACDSPTAPSRSPTTPSQNGTEPTQNRLNLTGTYTLTLSASSRCRLELPEALRTREYAATIDQAANSLKVTLQYPSPLSWGQPNTFTGWFDGINEVRFQFAAEEWWLDGGVELHANGWMTGTIVEKGLSGMLDGVVRAIVPNEDGRGNRSITCGAPDHGVVFSR